jgi:hypothetical protein
MTDIPLGIYQHYKGDFVDVIGVARHNETKEEMVVYRHLGEGESAGLWVRPVGMFLEQVMKEGNCGPRFAKIEGADPSSC